MLGGYCRQVGLPLVPPMGKLGLAGLQPALIREEVDARLRLVTKPVSTGSEPDTKTIGIVAVAVLAARAAAVFATIAATRRRTRSAASSGKRSR
jgi:hypothetical protein